MNEEPRYPNKPSYYLSRAFHGMGAMGWLNIVTAGTTLPMSLAIAGIAQLDPDLDYKADMERDMAENRGQFGKSYLRTLTVPAYYAAKTAAGVADAVGYAGRLLTGTPSQGKDFQFVNLVHHTFDKFNGVPLKQSTRLKAEQNKFSFQ